MYRPTSALSRTTEGNANVPVGKPFEIKAPLGLPAVPIPADDPPTADTVALGRRLYYDPALSADNTISCASCHGPQMGFTNTRPVSIGVGGKTGTRHSPTVMNSAYNTMQFWDGRAPSLEEQAKGPIANPVEMASTHADVVKRLQADPKYVALFKQAWGTKQVTIDLVAKSVAAFERTVLSGNSPFDPFLLRPRQNGTVASRTARAQLFMDPRKANCEVCHTVGKDALTAPLPDNLGPPPDLAAKQTDQK